MYGFDDLHGSFARRSACPGGRIRPAPALDRHYRPGQAQPRRRSEAPSVHEHRDLRALGLDVRDRRLGIFQVLHGTDHLRPAVNHEPCVYVLGEKVFARHKALPGDVVLDRGDVHRIRHLWMDYFLLKETGRIQKRSSLRLLCKPIRPNDRREPKA